MRLFLTILGGVKFAYGKFTYVKCTYVNASGFNNKMHIHVYSFVWNVSQTQTEVVWVIGLKSILKVIQRAFTHGA